LWNPDARRVADESQKVRLRDMRRKRLQMTGYLTFSSPGAVVFEWR